MLIDEYTVELALGPPIPPDEEDPRVVLLSLSLLVLASASMSPCSKIFNNSILSPKSSELGILLDERRRWELWLGLVQGRTVYTVREGKRKSESSSLEKLIGAERTGERMRSRARAAVARFEPATGRWDCENPVTAVVVPEAKVEGKYNDSANVEPEDEAVVGFGMRRRRGWSMSSSCSR
jgi:hypothetical protein